MRRALRAKLFPSSLLLAAAVWQSAATAQQPAACTAPKTSCAGANGYYASREDLDRLTAVADPILRELRTCLDQNGGKAATPALLIRWDSEGNPVSVKIEAPGFESLPCVGKASGKLSSLQNPHETAIRCEYGCAKPAPPPPTPGPTTAPPPVVFLPPGQQPPAQPPPAQPPAQQPGGAVYVPPPAGVKAGEQGPYSVHYEKVWYGWQGLVIDAAAWALTLGGGFAGEGSITAIGMISFALGFPIVHWAHAQVGRGFGSMGLRVGLPLAGAAIGAIAGLSGGNRGSGSSPNVETEAIVGAFVGAAGCSVIDAVAWGFKSEKVSNADAGSSGQNNRWIRWTPTADVRSDRAVVGVVGTF